MNKLRVLVSNVNYLYAKIPFPILLFVFYIFLMLIFNIAKAKDFFLGQIMMALLYKMGVSKNIRILATVASCISLVFSVIAVCCMFFFIGGSFFMLRNSIRTPKSYLEIDGSNFSVCMWKGSYKFIGSGFEIGLYQTDGKTLDTNRDLGMISSSLKLFDKRRDQLIRYKKKNKKMFWMTLFYIFYYIKSEDLCATITFTFHDEKYASKFASNIQTGGENIKCDNRNEENFDISQDKNTVTIIWGSKD